jgi:hypothetical protein
VNEQHLLAALARLSELAERFIEACPARSIRASVARTELYGAIDRAAEILRLSEVRSDPEAFNQCLRDLAAAGVFDEESA